jgi:thioredoxin reductase (NADPH)
VKIDAAVGNGRLELLELSDVKTGQKSSLKVNGLLVRVGLIANTAYLKDTLPLNSIGQIMVNDQMETNVSGIFGAGDVRQNSPMQIVTAVADGATAALYALKHIGV